MKKAGSFILTALFASVLFNGVSYAEKYKFGNDSGSNKTSSASSSSAGCAPPQGSAIMDLNNVRTIVYTGGDMWQNFSANQALYEVPKGSGKHSLFSGSLWMGGTDVNGQLKLAAMRFRQDGNDFWPGPLTTDGAASVTPDQCAKWDKQYFITRAEVNEFVAWFNDPPSFPNYSVSKSIIDYPAHGDVTIGQDFYQAPFFDKDGDGFYDPFQGDYPKYDLVGDIDCRVTRDIRLFGDETIWWVFNDKGNIHTESGADAIGMEVHAQAFAFATNDEVNDMTFYNYELINRSSFTLTETYFAQWVDADLGEANDDFVGCDVPRGLGYCYNGDDVDGSGGPGHYGANPPAVGVDFFEGPYQDNDGIDNSIGIGFNEALNGLGYGDNIIDNERYGMRRYVYHNNAPGVQGDPQTGPDHYNYMRGIWRDNTLMVYGGNGHINNCTTCEPAYFMFPGDSDQEDNWGTNGSPVASWTEIDANNTAGDRRFMQSAGPFTLLPGAVNDITVGVVWARASEGSAFASVEKLRKVDDLAQALFENCFKVLNGPDAPEVDIVELDQELIISLSNPVLSNNYNEEYEEVDPFIISPDSLSAQDRYDSIYRFQGYQIFQVISDDVSISECIGLGANPDRARLVAQCDVVDGVSQLINFYFDESLNASIPVEEIDKNSDKGIQHTFQVKEDLFSTTSSRSLVNHKTYYYISVAYAYNNYKTYDPNDALQLDGQKKPYLAGRKNALGGSIKVYSATPHKPAPQNGGTIINAEYGSGPKLTRHEGSGNGGMALDLTQESIDEILKNGRAIEITYENGAGPVDIYVYNPLSVPNAEFTLRLVDTDTTPDNLNNDLWELVCVGDDCDDDPTTTEVVVTSDRTISVANEQLIPEWGLSVRMVQQELPADDIAEGGFIEATMQVSNINNLWLNGVVDQDGATPYNWIRSGIVGDQWPDNGDDEQYFEKVTAAGINWAPYALVAKETAIDNQSIGAPAWNRHSILSKISNLHSVDVVFTPNQELWTRSPVVELAEDVQPSIGDALKMNLRMQPSVDKNGNPDGTGTMGMGWFPGYAINVETGERLNIIFGENSWLVGENGADMIWNPTSSEVDNLGRVLFGGMHYIYIMGHNGNTGNDCPPYDEGNWIYGKLSDGGDFTPSDLDKRNVYKDVMWVNLPLHQEGTNFLADEIKVRIRVARPYFRELSSGWTVNPPQNNNLPLYTFNTADLATVEEDATIAEDALDMIGVVPNPYYAYSEYERNQFDNRIKIINLPNDCVVSIYSINGNLIRRFQKSDPVTSVEWDLKNSAGIPIAGGVYLIHVEVPGIGEKVVKWFGALRPIDLDQF